MRRIRDFSTNRGVGTPLSEFFSDTVDEVFNAEYEDIANDLSDLYTTERSGPDLSLRVPPLRTLLRSRSIRLDEVRAGFYEIELLDFITVDRPLHILKILGNVGIGKSCLVHYTFKTICRKVPILNDICPIVLDFKTVRDANAHLGVFERLRAFQQSSHTDQEWYNEFHGEFWHLVSQLAESDPDSNADAARLLSDFGGALHDLKQKKQHDGRRCIPVILFDNVDALYLNQRQAVHEIVVRFAHDHHIHCILPYRPETVVSTNRVGLGLFAIVGYVSKLYPPSVKYLLQKRSEHLKGFVQSDYHKLLSDETSLYLEIDGNRVPVTSDSIIRSINLMIRDATKASESEWLWQIANGSVRNLMILVNIAFKRDDHYLRAVMRASRKPIGITLLVAQERMMRRILLGDYLLYIDAVDPSPLRIPNVFYLPSFESCEEHTLYWLLCYLNYSDHYVRLEDASKALSSVLPDPTLAEQYLANIIKRGMIEIVEADPLSDNKPKIIDISPRGTCMIDHMISNPQYVYNVVVDCPASLHSGHVFDREPDAYAYHTRVPAIEALLRRVIEAERRAIGKCDAAEQYSALRRVIRAGFLSDKLLAAFRSIVAWGEGPMASKPGKKAYEWAAELVDGDLAHQVGNLSERAYSVLQAEVKRDAATEIAEVKFPNSDGFLRVEFPRTLTLLEHIAIRVRMPAGLRQRNVMFLALCRVSGTGIRIAESLHLVQQVTSGNLACDIPLEVVGKGDEAKLKTATVKIFGNQTYLGEVTFTNN